MQAIDRGGVLAEPGADRALPHSIEAEQSVLGGLLLDNSAWHGIADAVQSADFFDGRHQAIFEAIGTMVAAGQPADVITVFEQLQTAGKAEECGGLVHLNALAQSVPTAANLQRHAGIVRERAVQRKLIALSDEIAGAAARGGDVAAIASLATTRFAELERTQVGTADGLPMLTLDELRTQAEATRWLVKHRVPDNAIGTIFGAPGTFKSFIAMDLALHVGHGLPWLGRKTLARPVVYLAGEGGAGLSPRFQSWHEARRLDHRKAQVHVVPVTLELSTESRTVVRKAQALGVSPGLVIIDTLSSSFGGDENAAAEVAAFLRTLGREFRDLWSCTVLLVHHSGHAATERPRGSSAFVANLDFVFGVHRDEREMLATMSCFKLKDGERFDDAVFSLTKHELGTDIDGDPVTSLVARHLTDADEVAMAQQAEQSAGRGGRTQLLLNLVQNGMSEKELRKAFYEDCQIAEPEARKKAYYRARDAAVRAQLIEVAQGAVIDLRGGK